MPDWLRGEIELEKQSNNELNKGGFEQREEDDDLANSDEHISSLIGMDRKMVAPTDEEVTAELVSETVKNDLKDIKNIIPYSEIPYLPEINFE